MKYYSEVDESLKPKLSLNFLLAEFEAIKTFDRDIRILNTKIECPAFETKDFGTRAYYKNISSVLQKFDFDDQNKK